MIPVGLERFEKIIRPVERRVRNSWILGKYTSKLKCVEDTVFQEMGLRDKRGKGRQIFLEYMSGKDIHNFPFRMKNKYSNIAAFKNCSLFQIKEDIERKIKDQVVLRSRAKLGR